MQAPGGHEMPASRRSLNDCLLYGVTSAPRIGACDVSRRPQGSSELGVRAIVR